MAFFLAVDMGSGAATASRRSRPDRPVVHREGHVGAALVGYAPVGGLAVAVGAETLAVVGGAAAVGLAMLPDADQNVPGIPHRGVTHTVHFAAAVGVALAAAGAAAGATAGILAALAVGVFGFAVGSVTVLSHVAADALTPMGVEPFRNGRRYSYDLVRASNPVANYLLLALGIVVVAVAAGVGSTLAGVFGT